jgi:hypothetical protein
MSTANEYVRISEQIELFEAGKLNLPSLIRALKGHLAAIGDPNPEWLQAFRSEWWELEQLNAHALDQKERGVIADYQSFVDKPSNRQNVSDALENLKKLLVQAQVSKEA